VRTQPPPSDLDHLARTARRLLADGQEMTLLINGISGRRPANPTVTSPEPVVTLHERDGRPSFLCEPGSPVTLAAHEGRSALLTVEGRAADGQPIALFVTGSLSSSGVDVVDDVSVDIVALPPRRVLLEYAAHADQPRRQYEIPPQVYERAEPGLRPADIAPIVAHINAGHQSELCHFLARHNVQHDARQDSQHDVQHDARQDSQNYDHPESDIAGADLVGLDEIGATINWVDIEGAHTTAITFARPAASIRELAALLRRELLG
jgi:hypothetical protein